MPSGFTGTAFDFLRMDLPCAKCGKTSKQPIAELVTNDVAICSYCEGTIDLSAKDTRAAIAKFANEAKEIKTLRVG